MTNLSIFRAKTNRRANRPGNSTAASPAIQAAPLVRAFVETGDERCPLAGIWSRLPACDQPTDEPHLARPAMRRLPRWRAFHSALQYPFA